MLLNLLEDIRKEAKLFNINLIIINDHSDENYSSVKLYLQDHFPKHYDYIENKAHQGKPLYWKTVANGYQYAKETTFDYFIQLPDDVKLVKHFFKQAIKSWDRINDPRKVCLSIAANYNRMMEPCWTSYMPHSVSFGDLDYIRTGWVDLCFISSQAYLEAVNYTVNPVDLRWAAKEGLSSGVGAQVSRLLIGKDLSIYSVKRSLVIHDHHPSVMHPKHREETRLVTTHDMSKIVATMATFPGREESLMAVIQSILPQVDELRIYANNYKKAPVNFKHRKLKWLFSRYHAGDIGDAGKFYATEDIDGYHFTIDDDIIYAPDYVAKMIACIEKYDRKYVVSLHGRTFHKKKMISYYKEASNRYSCFRSVPADTFAHVVGTGVLAYHTDTIRVPFKAFEASNMADIWFSKYCQEHGVHRMIMKHPGEWVKDSCLCDHAINIYALNCNDDSLQTKVANSVNWSLP